MMVLIEIECPADIESGAGRNVVRQAGATKAGFRGASVGGCLRRLTQAIEILQEHGGILLYLRQEGRGIGLAAKLDAYTLQDRGLDTYAANRALSLPDDARDYACGAAMMEAMGIRRIRLIANNPDKANQLAHHGIEILERVQTDTFLTEFNRDYLTAKHEVTGHKLSLG